MLCGLLPWNENSSITALYQKIKKDKVVFPNSCKVKTEIKDVVCNMMIVQEEKRYNINEVVNKLNEIEVK